MNCFCSEYPGFGTPNDWEDHNRVFGIDGPDVQYTVSSSLLPTLPVHSVSSQGK